MANEIDYKTVLADLRAKRAALDQAIVALEGWLGSAADRASELTAITAQHPSHTSKQFFGMTLPDAIHKYLQLRGPCSLTEITNALELGGLETTAKDFKRNVAATLTRLKNEKHTVIQRDNGWVLVPSYLDNRSANGPAQMTPKGQDNQPRRTKLTFEQINQLRTRSSEGMSQDTLAREFGISQGSVSRILRTNTGQQRARGPRLTTEQIETIKSRHRQGSTQADIARELGVSRGSVWNVISGKREAKAA
jgi:predicted DNA-binding protein (UPF0251 family)